MSQPYVRQAFHSPSAPVPNGNYSHAVVQQSSATLHIAGWMGDDPSTGKIVEGGIGAQTVRSSQTSSSIAHIQSQLSTSSCEPQGLAPLLRADTKLASSNAQHPILPPSRQLRPRQDRAPEDLHHRHQAIPRGRCNLGRVGWATVSGEHVCAGKLAVSLLFSPHHGVTK